MPGFSDSLEAAAHSLQARANRLAQRLSRSMEAPGRAVARALEAADSTGPNCMRWWLGETAFLLGEWLAVTLKALLGVLAGVSGGLLRTSAGLLRLQRESLARGLGDIISSPCGAVILVTGKTLALLQHLLPGLQARARYLSTTEEALLRPLFQASLRLEEVRLVEGRAGVFSLNRRPFALGNTIYLKQRSVAREPQLLVHECVHVWQYHQRGARYASDALYAQWFIGNPYSWEDEIRRGKTRWERFNNEAEATFIEHIYAHGELLAGSEVLARGSGAYCAAQGRHQRVRLVCGGVDYTALADQALDTLRGSIA